LSPSELRALYDTATRITEEQVTLAERAWDAWRADHPGDLHQLLEAGTAALPFLAGAIRRHLQDLPWTSDGLSLTERLALAQLREGALPAGDLFERVQADEEHPWMGDSMLFAELDRLRFLRNPLVRAASDQPIRRATRVEASDLACQILDGAVDALAANRVDRWVGGVHVTSEGRWRWNGSRGRIWNPMRDSPPPS
jgi:hypothetical protein